MSNPDFNKVYDELGTLNEDNLSERVVHINTLRSAIQNPEKHPVLKKLIT
jgi:hypothetical protein